MLWAMICCLYICICMFAKVEMNPCWQQKQLREFCEKKGIHITAFSPLGAKGTIWGTNWIWESEVLKEIAKAKGKTIAQVIIALSFQFFCWYFCFLGLWKLKRLFLIDNGNLLICCVKVSLRWVYEQGVSVVVKSYNKERMKENLEIFDWSLNSEDLQKISQIPQRRGATAREFISDEGPYKSLSELWDGEI